MAACSQWPWLILNEFTVTAFFPGTFGADHGADRPDIAPWNLMGIGHSHMYTVLALLVNLQGPVHARAHHPLVTSIML